LHGITINRKFIVGNGFLLKMVAIQNGRRLFSLICFYCITVVSCIFFRFHNLKIILSS
jgi:hypothetical protein